MRIATTVISILTVTCTVSAVALDRRSDVGGPCADSSNCYGGANCCSNICTLGDCKGSGRNNAGAVCQEDWNCFGGAICCSMVCKLGSCRMNGSCDADNDCYGWCHNNPGKCNIPAGKTEGKCKC